MPLIISPALTKTANSVDMYVPIVGDVAIVPQNLLVKGDVQVVGNEIINGSLSVADGEFVIDVAGNVTAGKNVTVVGATTLDGTLSVADGKMTVDLSGSITTAKNIVASGILTVNGNATGASNPSVIKGDVEFRASTTPGQPVRKGVSIYDGNFVVDTGTTALPIYSILPYIAGRFAGFHTFSSIPTATGTGAVQMETLYCMTLGTLRICWGKLGVLSAANFNNNSISQIPADSVPGGQQSETGLYETVYYINIQAQGVSSAFGIVNCVSANDDGYITGFNAGDLTQTKAFFLIIGKANGVV